MERMPHPLRPSGAQTLRPPVRGLGLQSDRQMRSRGWANPSSLSFSFHPVPGNSWREHCGKPRPDAVSFSRERRGGMGAFYPASLLYARLGRGCPLPLHRFLGFPRANTGSGFKSVMNPAGLSLGWVWPQFLSSHLAPHALGPSSSPGIVPPTTAPTCPPPVSLPAPVPSNPAQGPSPAELARCSCQQGRPGSAETHPSKTRLLDGLGRVPVPRFPHL